MVLLYYGAGLRLREASNLIRNRRGLERVGPDN